MKKPTLNSVVDSIALILFLCLLSTGFIIFLVIPPASGYSIWAMGRDIWETIHFWVAMSFLGMMTLHVILHWSWITTKIGGDKQRAKHSKRRSLFALLLFIVVLLLLLAPFLSPFGVDSTESSQGVHADLIEKTTTETELITRPV